MNTKPITKAVDAVGGQSALARAINVAPPMVWQWVKGRRPVPARYCLPIEDVTHGKITRHDLRPDVFGVDPAREAH